MPARFGGGAVALAPAAHADAAAEASIAAILASGGVALTDWGRLEREPTLSARFRHVVLIDPPPTPALERIADRAERDGFLHLAWGPAEVEFSLRAWDAQWPSRPALAGLYRRLEGLVPAGEGIEAGR